MNAYRFTRQDILTYIQMLSITPINRNVLESYIYHQHGGLLEFIVNLFRSTTYYLSLINNQDQFEQCTRVMVEEKLRQHRFDLTNPEIIASDVYDVLYNIHSSDSYRFNDQFYEDLFNYIETLQGTKYATENIEELSESISIILEQIERMLFGSYFHNDTVASILVMFIEQTNTYLNIYVITEDGTNG